MARSEARLPFDTWRRRLAGATAHEKLLYAVLTTEQTVNHAGVGRLCLPLWAADASLTEEEAETALAGLVEAGRIVVDHATYEVFIVSLMIDDKVADQPYVLKGALKEALLTVSPRIRVALAAQLRRLPPKQPDGESKTGRRIVYPDPHATADELDPPPVPKPSPKGPETLFDSAADPSEREGGRGGGGGGGISPTPELPLRRSAQQRGTRIPDDFAKTCVTAEMVAWARKEFPHVDGRAQTEAFVDHFRAAPGSRGVKLDWVATWRNWIRRAAEQTPRGAQPRHLAPVVELPTDPAAAFADIRDRADARTAERLLRMPYLPAPQPPSDKTPALQWARVQALAFIDQHRDAILAAVAEGRSAG